MRDEITKYRDIILLTIGTLLVILSLCLLFYDRIELLKSNVFAEVEMEKYRENNLDSNSVDEIVTDEVEAETDIIDSFDEEDTIDNNTNTNTSTNTKTNTSTKSSTKSKIAEDKAKMAKEFIGYLEIKKINLKQGFLSKNSYYNDVKYNIQVLSASDYPDKSLGNVILAAHSGTSWVSHFKNLYQLVIGDEAKIYYKNYVYTYKIVNIYNVPKTGKVLVDRDVHKSCLTLITCTYGSKTEQTVYILELTSKVKDGG